MHLHNFYAGPSILSPEVLQNAIKAIEKKEGMSLLEYSHRSEKVQALFEETKALIREMMQLDSRYEILFLHGGARMQNCMIPYNISREKQAYCIDTGIWSKKTIDDAKVIRTQEIAASSQESGYDHIPSIEQDLSDGAYLHFTSNNTVHGAQFFDFPKVDCPLIADMSSDILSRKIDFNQFDMIYAGLQKNLGTAGGCLVVIDKNLVKKEKDIPSMLSYQHHIEANSMLNTPPIFTVLLCNLSLKWIKSQGGLTAIEAKNQEKAKLLYDTIDNSSLFEAYVQKEYRSLMNATFYMKDKSLETQFLEFCDNNQIVGIKGYRLKGGFRVSLYNSLPLASVQHLVAIMQDFEKRLA